MGSRHNWQLPHGALSPLSRRDNGKSVCVFKEVGHRDERMSGDELESVAVSGAHNAKVAVVEGGDGGQLEAFGHGDQGGVRQVQAEICVSVGQFDAALPVGLGQLERLELASGDQAQEPLVGPERSRSRINQAVSAITGVGEAQPSWLSRKALTSVWRSERRSAATSQMLVSTSSRAQAPSASLRAAASARSS